MKRCQRGNNKCEAKIYGLFIACRAFEEINQPSEPCSSGGKSSRAVRTKYAINSLSELMDQVQAKHGLARSR